MAEQKLTGYIINSMHAAGLTSVEATNLLKNEGLNEIREQKPGILVKILKSLISPTSILLLSASMLSFFLSKTFDSVFILILLIVNIAITIWQERKADKAIEKLNDFLSRKVKVRRDGKWLITDSKFIAKGDLIELTTGEVVPADCRIIDTNHTLINESVLTGESFPVEKGNGDAIFSGSFVVSGTLTAEVLAVAYKTKFGKILFNVSGMQKKSLLEKDITSISKYLLIVSLACIAFISIVLISEKVNFLEILTFNLSLLVAGVPISLPTVMTLIIEFGVINLSEKNVVVRRISALEDLANVSFLLTDKTGTLTENKIVIKDIYAYDGYKHSDVIRLAAMVAAEDPDNPISKAIFEKAAQLNIKVSFTGKIKYISADSVRKRSTLVLRKNNKDNIISIGAPQVIIGYCKKNEKIEAKLNKEVLDLAKYGFRTLAIATGRTSKEKDLDLVGFLGLTDVIRSDAGRTLRTLKENGIDASMITGDNHAIASYVMSQIISKDKKILAKDELDKIPEDRRDRKFFADVGAFAEVYPDDKLDLVKTAKKYFVVAATGDGVNDLPSVKSANVGIAVANAVDVLKASADIVLLTQGISVISDAISESRKIFQRIYTYSLYRISESLRLLITITVLSIFYKQYPLNALQIIILALLNDLPIISLGLDRVKIASKPAVLNIKERFLVSSFYGMVGVVNSLLLFYLMTKVFALPWNVIETMYFLKLTVSGHLLIYVAHTSERWYKFLPSKEVIIATTLTQLAATFLALTGFLMPSRLSLAQVILVWLWAFVWMQVSEAIKIFRKGR